MKQISILDAIDYDKIIFSDDYGYLRMNGAYAYLYFFTDEGKRIDINNIYAKRSQGYHLIFSGNNRINKKMLENFKWDEEYYYSSGNNYGWNNRPVEYTKIENFRVFIRFQVLCYLEVEHVRNGRNGNLYNEIEFEIKSKNDLSKKILWTIDDDYKTHRPMYYNMKVGDSYIFGNHMKAIITKIYDYPNNDNLFCEIKNTKDSVINIKFDNLANISYLPYDKSHISIFKELNSNLNEIKLAPVLVKSADIYNVYWKKIEDAANYRVLVYTTLKTFGLNDLYKLGDYEVDRNTFFFKINNLVNQNYIFKVIAEDRNGNVIAESRGTDNGLPRYFEEVQ